MAVEVLQLDSTHLYYESEFLLDGESFRLLARFNRRVESWFLSLYDVNGDPIATGRRVTVGNFLFPWLVGRNRPAGQLIALDTSAQDSDPGENDLGNRVVIVYADAEEIEGLGGVGG